MLPRTRAARAVAAAGAGVLLALTLHGASPVPAAAAGNELLVSRDGVHFSAGDTLPLFRSMGRVVPGDHSTEHVWVKNDSERDAVLRIDLIDPRSDDPALAAAFSLSVAPSGGQGSPPVTIATGVRNGSCTVLRDGVALRPGQDLRLRLIAGVDVALDERHGMRGTVGFRLRGVLIEAAAAETATPGSSCRQPSEPPSTPSDPDVDQLPTTGSGAWLSIGLAGGASIVAGIIFCVLGWRRRMSP